MRQTAPRRPAGKPAATETARLNVGAGDHLDLGMIVSVYHAETSRRQAGDAAEATPPPPDFIEH
jgi:hypothetical protein